MKVINCSICNGYITISKTRLIELEKLTFDLTSDGIKSYGKERVCGECFDKLKKGELIKVPANQGNIFSGI